MRRILLALGVLFWSSHANALTCTAGACTITNSSAAAILIGNNAHYLVIDNESTTATIACAFGGATAALNTAGSFTVGPGQTRLWQFTSDSASGLLAIGNLNCISSAATSAATIMAR